MTTGAASASADDSDATVPVTVGAGAASAEVLLSTHASPERMASGRSLRLRAHEGGVLAPP